MNKNVQSTNLELTPAIHEYIDKRFSAFDKFISTDPENVKCDVEVAKTTDHHRSGDIFRAEVRLSISGHPFYAASEREDLYSAIDEVKDEIVRAITTHKDKAQTLERKGGLKFKNIIRGFDRFKKKKE